MATRPLFRVVPLSKPWIIVHPNTIKQILADLFGKARNNPKHNDLKIESFLFYITFLNTTHISCKASWVKVKTFLLTIILIPKNQNEAMVTAIQPFSHVSEQLKINNFLYFLPSKRPLHEKNRKYAKSLTRFLLVFNYLQPRQHHQSKLIRTTIPNSKDNQEN